MRVAASIEAPTLPARPTRWVGGLVGALIGGAVFVGEYGLNESWLTASGAIVGPLLGAWLAPSVRIDEPLVGWLSFRMAALAVLLGALLTPVLSSDGLAVEDIGPVAAIAALGLVILGVPMLGITLLCAILWVFVVRTVTYR